MKRNTRNADMKDMKDRLNCDNCKHYEWYYDRCRKWDCEVDARKVHSCFEEQETLNKDIVTNGGQNNLNNTLNH